MSRRLLASLTASALTASALAGALLIVAPSASANPHRLPPPDDAAMSASIAGLPDEAVTSAHVAVSGRDGRWAGRAGVRDVRTGGTVPKDARFRIGSATKMFTAAMVIQLVAEGRLALDDRVQRWLPGVLPASYPAMTIRQLLDHTSGLPCRPRTPATRTQPGSCGTASTGTRHSRWFGPRPGTPMAFIPGTQQQYNGVNYFLAGMVVEEVTGHDYAHELRKRLLRPLGLDDTYLPRRGEVRLRGRHPHRYVQVDGVLVDVTAQRAYAWAEGGMVSTTRDLGRFLRRLMAGEVVPQPWRDEMLTVPDVPDAGGGQARFGLGLERTELPGGIVVWGRAGACPAIAASRSPTEDRARALALSLTTTGNNDGSESLRLMGIALAAFGAQG